MSDARVDAIRKYEVEVSAARKRFDVVTRGCRGDMDSSVEAAKVAYGASLAKIEKDERRERYLELKAEFGPEDLEPAKLDMDDAHLIQEVAEYLGLPGLAGGHQLVKSAIRKRIRENMPTRRCSLCAHDSRRPDLAPCDICRRQNNFHPAVCPSCGIGGTWWLTARSELCANCYTDWKKAEIDAEKA